MISSTMNVQIFIFIGKITLLDYLDIIRPVAAITPFEHGLAVSGFGTGFGRRWSRNVQRQRFSN
jgi:hypothetical protein